MNRVKLLVLVTFWLMYSSVFAQEPVPMADGMRAEGKIYVVVAIILVILGGLLVYLFRMDKKITRLEKNLDKRS